MWSAVEQLLVYPMILLMIIYTVRVRISECEDKTYVKSSLSFFFAFVSAIPFPPSLIRGGAVAQSVERTTPGEEVPGSIPAVAAGSLLVGSVSV